MRVAAINNLVGCARSRMTFAMMAGQAGADGRSKRGDDERPMARRKNQPEAVRVKGHLSERLRSIPTALVRERGGWAGRVAWRVRPWYNSGAGAPGRAGVLPGLVERRWVERMWLLYGRGAKYRTVPAAAADGGDEPASIGALLRTALERLERREA